MEIFVLLAALFVNTEINTKKLKDYLVFENVDNCQLVNQLYFNGEFVCKKVELK